MREFIKLSWVLINIVLVSCAGTSYETDTNGNPSKKPYVNDEIKVDTIVANKTDFYLEILSNGKVQSQKKAEIPFEVEGYITSILIKNGQRVRKGTVLATIDPVLLKTRLKQSKINLEKSSIEMQDVLLGFGYKIKDTAKVDKNVLKNIKIRSNYSKSLAEFNEAKQNLQLSVIRAPFNGVVANLKAQPHNLTSVFDNKLCTLIDDRNLEVFFPILESELYEVKEKQQVSIISFTQPEKSISGQISEINPVVDENGMVAVKALFNNTDASLFDGMNVKIKIQKTFKDKIVVPKSAVLSRQNRNVVFKYINGEAKWVYVEVGQENMDRIVIKKGIQEGDQIIISGNENLAHNTEVVLKK